MLRKNESGFTLIEFIVAGVFIGIVVLAVSNLFIGIGQINKTADDYTTATAVAQQLVEQYRNTAYSSIAVGTADVTSSALGPHANLASPRSATINVTQANPGGIKQLDVTVSWMSLTGAKTIHMTTQISYVGLNR